jgi:DNA-3-methyladenine glycosylase II
MRNLLRRHHPRKRMIQYPSRLRSSHRSRSLLDAPLSRGMTMARMITHIHTEADLDAGIAALIARDPRFAAVAERTGRPPLRRRDGGFAGLAQIVMGQQLSTASAAAIYGRLAAACDPLDAACLLRLRKDRLLRVGLSNAKVKTLKAVAKAIEARHIDLDALADIPADEAHNRLTALHGIGPWTADLYLLACLGHADAWPAGDLALQEAARIAFGLPARPSTREMAPLAEGWRPWRAVAARLLWSYYRVVKRREGVIVAPAKPVAPEAKKAVAKKAPGRTGRKNGR